MVIREQLVVSFLGLGTLTFHFIPKLYLASFHTQGVFVSPHVHENIALLERRKMKFLGSIDKKNMSACIRNWGMFFCDFFGVAWNVLNDRLFVLFWDLFVLSINETKTCSAPERRMNKIQIT